MTDPMIIRVRAALDWYEQCRPGAVTCSISGTGAIAELERVVAAVHHVRYAVAMPSATTALLAAMCIVGVGASHVVVVPARAWPAGSAVASALGADVVAVDPWDPGSLRHSLVASAGRPTVAVPVPARDVASCAGVTEWLLTNGVTVIEDLADACDARPSAPLAAVSFGAGKEIDAFEGGALLTNDTAVYDRILWATQHPSRQRLAGLHPSAAPLCLRIHPVAAVVALHTLHLRREGGVAASVNNTMILRKEATQ